MRAKQTGREERATCPVYTAVRFIAMLCCECLSALWVIASGVGRGGVLRICADVPQSETERCQFTACTFCI